MNCVLLGSVADIFVQSAVHSDCCRFLTGPLKLSFKVCIDFLINH